MKIKTKSIQVREFNFKEDENFKVEERTVTFPFASRNPYERWYGFEVIDTKNMDLSRLKNKAMLLFNHNRDDYIGVVEDAWYNAVDDRNWCRVKFDTHPEAEKIFQSVKNGIFENVSFGYKVQKMEKIKTENEISTFEVIATPFEISFVTVPADQTVGYKRSMVESEEVEFEFKEIENDENNDNNNDLSNSENIKDEQTREVDSKDVDKKDNEENEQKFAKNKKDVHNKITSQDFKYKGDNMTDFTQEIKQIKALAEKFDCSSDALRFIEEGKTSSEFKDFIMEKQRTKAIQADIKRQQEGQEMASELKMTFGEVLRQAIIKSENGEVSGEFKEFQTELKRSQGNYNGGVIIPDYLAFQRDVTVATPTSAGNLVARTRSNQMINPLRPESVLAGATYLMGLKGPIDIPRDNGGVEASYVAEKTSASDSSLNLDLVTLSPKTISATTKFTRNIANQSAFNIEQLIGRNFRNAISDKIEKEVLAGKGNGITAVKGLLEQLKGTGQQIANADALTWSLVVQLEAMLKAGNANLASSKYFGNSAIMELLKNTQKAVGLDFILGDNGKVNNYDFVYSGVLGEDASYTPFLFGDISNIMIGLFSNVEIHVDTDIKPDGTKNITSFLDFDATTRHIETFAYVGIKTGA